MDLYVNKIVQDSIKEKMNDFLFSKNEEEILQENFYSILAQSLDQGKGTFYHMNGNKKYEGTFKNGKLEGKGKYYFSNEKLRYDGMFKNGLFHGKGTEYYGNNMKFIGNFKEGKKNGNGTIYKDDKIIFQGKWNV